MNPGRSAAASCNSSSGHCAATSVVLPEPRIQVNRQLVKRAVELLAEKKIKQARFGCREGETEHCVWAGWVQHKPSFDWTRQESRPEYRQRLTLTETLNNALDVNGCRKHFQLGYQFVSDEKLVWKPHYYQSWPKFAAPRLRKVSQKWLLDHPLESVDDRPEDS